MGVFGFSEGGGAGVSSNERMKEKRFMCGDGRVMILLEDESASHGIE